MISLTLKLTLTQTHSHSHSLTLTLSHDHKTLPAASFGSPTGGAPWVTTRARSCQLVRPVRCPVSLSAVKGSVGALQWLAGGSASQGPAAGSAIQGPASAREIANQAPASARASHAAGLARHDCKLEREKTRKRFEEVFGPLLQE